MQLYNYFRSSASYRVRIALALKGLDYEYVPVHLVKNEQLAAPFRGARAGAAGAAAATTATALLTQSLAIIEYLDETHPEPPLLPGRRRSAARACARSRSTSPARSIRSNNLRVLRYLVRELKVSDDDKNRWYRHWVETGLEVGRAPARRAARDRALLPRRHADAGRLRAGAADLQRAAHGLPARPRADGDARLRGLHGASRRSSTTQPSACPDAT